MTLLEAIRLPRSIAQRLRLEAEKQGMALEEYLVELATRDMDPPERAREYIEAARGLLEQAREELRRGDVRQAAEKAWGAAALAVKAYAAWREGKRPGHRELRSYTSSTAERAWETDYQRMECRPDNLETHGLAKAY